MVPHLTVRERVTPVGGLRIYIFRGKPLQVTLGEEGNLDVPRALRPPELVAEMERSLQRYFAGKDIERGLCLRLLELQSLSTFENAVYRSVIDIPRGCVLSYREIAERAGYPRAARAVGAAMRRNRFPIFIPCHRVIKSDGCLGGFGGREHIKARLLEEEGLEVIGGRVGARSI